MACNSDLYMTASELRKLASWGEEDGDNGETKTMVCMLIGCARSSKTAHTKFRVRKAWQGLSLSIRSRGT